MIIVQVDSTWSPLSSWSTPSPLLAGGDMIIYHCSGWFGTRRLWRSLQRGGWCWGWPRVKGELELSLVLVLTLFWPWFDLVLTLFWPCVDLVLTLCWCWLGVNGELELGLVLVLTLFWPWFDLVLTLCWPCVDLVLVLTWCQRWTRSWSSVGVDLILTLCWPSVNVLVLTWCQRLTRSLSWPHQPLSYLKSLGKLTNYLLAKLCWNYRKENTKQTVFECYPFLLTSSQFLFFSTHEGKNIQRE